jgi:hypothetical protein
VGTILGTVAVVLLARNAAWNTAHATPLPALVATTAAAALSTPPAAPPVTTLAPPVRTAPVLHEVLVSVTPADAALTRDGHDLGGAPAALHLAEGETAALVISRKGYRTKTVTVDSTSPKVAVALDGAFGPPPRVAVPRPMGGAIDDVGDPFAKKR